MTDSVTFWEDEVSERVKYCGQSGNGMNFTTSRDSFNLEIQLQSDVEDSFVQGFYYQGEHNHELYLKPPVQLIQ